MSVYQVAEYYIYIEGLNLSPVQVSEIKKISDDNDFTNESIGNSIVLITGFHCTDEAEEILKEINKIIEK